MSLHTEIIAALLTAGTLGLVCGWMISRVRGERRLQGTISVWEAKYAKLELESKTDTDRLESRIETLGVEMRELVKRDREAEERLARSEAGAHKAQSDVIDLNRRQAETQERLQRIVHDKDRRIAELEARVSPRPSTPRRAAAPDPATSRRSAPRPPSRSGSATGPDRPARTVAATRTAHTPSPPPSPAPSPAPAPAARRRPATATGAVPRAARGRPVTLTPPGEAGGAPRRTTPTTAANASGASWSDESMDATELVDDVDATYRADETADDPAAARGGRSAGRRRPAPAAAVAATADATHDDDTGTLLLEGDDPLDATGESTVVLDEAQIRDARAARRRGR